jgi:hypothetical protein
MLITGGRALLARPARPVFGNSFRLFGQAIYTPHMPD